MGIPSDEKLRRAGGAPEAKRPWQFSIASMLIAFVVVAVALGTMVAYPHSICVICFLFFLAGLWVLSVRIAKDEAA